MSGDLLKLNLSDSGNVFFSKVKSFLELLSKTRPTDIRVKKTGDQLDIKYNYLGEREVSTTTPNVGSVYVEELRLRDTFTESVNGVYEYEYYLEHHLSITDNPNNYGNTGSIIADGVELVEQSGVTSIYLWLLYRGKDGIYLFRPDGNYEQLVEVENASVQLNYMRGFLQDSINEEDSQIKEYIAEKLGWNTTTYPSWTVLSEIDKYLTLKAQMSVTPYVGAEWFLVQHNYICSEFVVLKSTLPQYCNFKTLKLLYCRRNNLILGMDAGNTAGDHGVVILSIDFQGAVFPYSGSGTVTSINQYFLPSGSIGSVSAACPLERDDGVFPLLLDSSNSLLVDSTNSGFLTSSFIYLRFYYYPPNSAQDQVQINPRTLRIFPLRNGYLISYKLAQFDQKIYLQYASEIIAVDPAGFGFVMVRVFYKEDFSTQYMFLDDPNDAKSVVYSRSTISYNTVDGKNVLVYVKDYDSSSKIYSWNVLSFKLGFPLPTHQSSSEGLYFSSCRLFNLGSAAEAAYAYPHSGHCSFYSLDDGRISALQKENMQRNWEPENAVYEIDNVYETTTGYQVSFHRKWFDGLHWAQYGYIVPIGEL